MKKIFILFWVLIVGCNSSSVPVEIQKKFLDIEPSAYNIEWFNNGDMYRVYYKLKDKPRVTSYFDFDGNWMETETEIEIEDLNVKILRVLNVEFSEYEVIDIEIVKTSDGQVLYEVDLSRGSKTYDILFDTTGRILRKKI